MQNYKVLVNKWSKRYTFIISALDKNQAEERMHNEWYSILNIENFSQENSNKEIEWNMFLFEIKKNWELKKWKAWWNDIFKVYINLRKNLWYNVLKLYPEKEKNLSEDYYKKIIIELEEEYNLFILNNKKNEENEIKENNLINNNPKKEFEDFYLKKELNETYKLIWFILDKIKNILDWKELKNINELERIKLKEIYNSIIKIKTTTNIYKLKEIGELALVKIWKLEKESIEKEENIEVKKLLKDTNSLLKKIWSKSQIIENKNNYNLILKNIFINFFKYIKEVFGFKKIDKNKIDFESYYYIKNELLLKKYEEKLKLNRRQIIKNFFLFKDNEENMLKRNVIKQNILLLRAKKKWIFYSYTKIKNWYNDLIIKLINIIRYIREYMFYIIIIYTLFFVFFINISFYLKNINNSININFLNMDYLNYNWIFYFIVLLFLYIILFLSRNLISIIVNSFLIFFIIIIWVINF